FQKPKDLIEGIDQVLKILDPEGKTAVAAGGKAAKQKTGMIRRGTATGLRPQLPSKKKPSDPANKAVKAKSSGELKPTGPQGEAQGELGTGKYKRVPARRGAGSGARPGTEAANAGVKGSTLIVAGLVVLLLVVLGIAIAMVMR